MGYKILDLTVKILSANQTTLKVWQQQQKDIILIWLLIVKKLDGVSVKNGIPVKYTGKFIVADDRYMGSRLK